MKVQPYVFFDGKCEEALEFYKRAIGAKVNALMRFGEAPDQSQIKPESKDKVMHAVKGQIDGDVVWTTVELPPPPDPE
jgi:PhnB protein